MCIGWMLSKCRNSLMFQQMTVKPTLLRITDARAMATILFDNSATHLTGKDLIFRRNEHLRKCYTWKETLLHGFYANPLTICK